MPALFESLITDQQNTTMVRRKGSKGNYSPPKKLQKCKCSQSQDCIKMYLTADRSFQLGIPL
jgi:hypothetical protein